MKTSVPVNIVAVSEMCFGVPGAASPKLFRMTSGEKLYRACTDGWTQRKSICY